MFCKLQNYSWTHNIFVCEISHTHKKADVLTPTKESVHHLAGEGLKIADNHCRCIFLKEHIDTLSKVSLTFIPQDNIDN